MAPRGKPRGLRPRRPKRGKPLALRCRLNIMDLACLARQDKEIFCAIRAVFPSSACKFPLSHTCPIHGKLEQICFQFWVALSFGEPCAIFGSFQTLSRMFSHGRAVSAGAVKEIIGWAAGSVPLRLRQLKFERIGRRRSPGRKGTAPRLQFGGSGRQRN